MFTHESYRFSVLKSDDGWQPHHGRFLTDQGYCLKNGVFIRRELVATRNLASLWDLPGREMKVSVEEQAVGSRLGQDSPAIAAAASSVYRTLGNVRRRPRSATT